jgi:hypothetical protein
MTTAERDRIIFDLWKTSRYTDAYLAKFFNMPDSGISIIITRELRKSGVDPHNGDRIIPSIHSQHFNHQI